MKLRKCKGSWLNTYLRYASRNESPTEFHAWTGLSALSSALGRNIVIPRVQYKIYPNLYIVLVATSARCRKSSAVNVARDLIKAVKPPIPIFAQKMTAPALIQALAESKRGNDIYGLAISSELSVFLGFDSVKSGIVGVLTDLYDSHDKWEYHTRGRGKETIENTTMGMLAATTLDDLKDTIPLGAIGGGFTSRLIFIYADRPSKCVLFGEEGDDSYGMTEEQRKLKEILIYDLEVIRDQVKGKIRFTPEAKAISEEWYRGNMNTTQDKNLDGYFGRKHDTMFKIATLLSASDSDSLLITDHHINRALDLLDKAETGLAIILSKISTSEKGKATDQILEIVQRNDMIKHSDLLRKCWRFSSSIEVLDHLKTLVDSRQIEEFVEDGGRNKYYKLRR